MKKEEHLARVIIVLVAFLIVSSISGCVVMYKVQGLEAKDPQEVKMTGPEYKVKAD